MGQQKRRRHEGDDEPDQPCGAVTSHKWYSGPMCKNCYRRNNTEHRKQSKMAKTEDAGTESGGDIPLVCLKVSAARCALPPIAPALSPPGHCLLAPAWAHRLSVIPRALVDRSNPPPDSDDDEGDECIEYDLYGWFKFESDADGVQRLDRQWVPLHDLQQAEGWEAAVLKLEERLKMARTDMAARRAPTRSPET